VARRIVLGNLTSAIGARGTWSGEWKAGVTALPKCESGRWNRWTFRRLAGEDHRRLVEVDLGLLPRGVAGHDRDPSEAAGAEIRARFPDVSDSYFTLTHPLGTASRANGRLGLGVGRNRGRASDPLRSRQLGWEQLASANLSLQYAMELDCDAVREIITKVACKT